MITGKRKDLEKHFGIPNEEPEITRFKSKEEYDNLMKIVRPSIDKAGKKLGTIIVFGTKGNKDE